MSAVTGASIPRIIGRYAVYGELAAGGMASVHLGRVMGAVGFSRVVAVKRMHEQFAKDPDFVDMFLDEARIVGRIRHPNVIPTIDVVQTDDDLLIVMEYVAGESLAKLLRFARDKGERIPLNVLAAIMVAVLQGLHAAHDATSETGESLNIVHRDVSPQNILVGIDGVPRILDFGIAKAVGRAQVTRGNQVKGKLAYLAPEQIQNPAGVDRRTDVYAAGIVFWESLTGKRLFTGDNEGTMIMNVMKGCQTPPSAVMPGIPESLDAVTMYALSLDQNGRFDTARAMANAIEDAVGVASPRAVGEWVERIAPELFADRRRRVAQIENAAIPSDSRPSVIGIPPYDATPVRVITGRTGITDQSVPGVGINESTTSAVTGSVQVGQDKQRSRVPLFLGIAALLIAGVGVTVFVMRPSPKSEANSSDKAERAPREKDEPTSRKSADVEPKGSVSVKAAPSPSATEPATVPSPTASVVASTSASASTTAKKVFVPTIGPKAKVCETVRVMKSDGSVAYEEKCK